METSSARSIESKSLDRPLQDQRLSHRMASLFSRVTLLVILNGLFFMCLAFPVGAEWTAPYFVVYPKDPWQSVAAANNGVIKENSSLPDLKFLAAGSTPKSNAAGKALNQAAAIYAQEGFMEPTFSPKLKNDTRGVFMYTYPGTAGNPKKETDGEYFPAACDKNEAETYLRFAQAWLMLDQKHTTNLTVLAAHELFHAIQFQYPFHFFIGKLRCNSAGWIDEGTADAAGNFLLERQLGPAGEGGNGGKKGKQFPKNPGFYGIRPYDVPLYKDLAAWDHATITSRFSLKPDDDFDDLVGYWTSSFWRYLMDRFGTSTEKLDPKRLKMLATLMSAEAPGDTDNQNSWLDWTANRISSIWPKTDFSYVYAQFLGEFAAWPGSKYPQDRLNDLLNGGFGKCEKVTLTRGKKSAKPPIQLDPRTNMDFALYPVSGRCIQVTVKGFKGKRVQLEIEAEVKPIERVNINGISEIVTPAKELADQLRLSFAREEDGKANQGELIENCYQIARKKPNKQFPCAFKGNLNPKNKNSVHSWKFEKSKVKHSTFTRTYILSNVKPKTPSATKGISKVTIHIALRVFNGKTQKWTKFDPPKAYNLDMIPDLSLPKRQQLYGIKKNSGVGGVFNPVNMGTFDVYALDETGKKTATYRIMAAEPVAFGQTGPFQALVERVDVKSSPQGGEQHSMGQTGLLRTVTGNRGPAVTNMLCQVGTEPIGNITSSDDEILTFTINTPLCEFSPNNIAACQNGCPVVDHLKGELSVPFGWRYFSENKIEDLVTPGVLLDIDRYHHEVFGTPLHGLGSGDDEPGDSNSGGPGGSLIIGGTGGLPAGNPLICDCSCENYTQLNEAYDNMTASKDTLPDLNAALQIAQCRLKCRKPFRECRRVERQAQQTH